MAGQAIDADRSAARPRGESVGMGRWFLSSSSQSSAGGALDSIIVIIARVSVIGWLIIQRPGALFDALEIFQDFIILPAGLLYYLIQNRFYAVVRQADIIDHQKVQQVFHIDAFHFVEN